MKNLSKSNNAQNILFELAKLYSLTILYQTLTQSWSQRQCNW